MCKSHLPKDGDMYKQVDKEYVKVKTYESILKVDNR